MFAIVLGLCTAAFALSASPGEPEGALAPRGDPPLPAGGDRAQRPGLLALALTPFAAIGVMIVRKRGATEAFAE